LCADEQPLQAAAGGDVGVAGLRKRVGEVAACTAQRRIETREQAGDEGACEGVEEETPVERDLCHPRKRFGEVVEELDGAAGERESEDSAEDGEKQKLTEQLRDDGAARGAEREAERDFALAVGSAGEQQRGDVDAAMSKSSTTAP
jgi:hypothetical protein